MSRSRDIITQNYENAKEIYAGIGVDVDKAIKRANEIPISMHCWQGDDVSGFENPDVALSGGTLVTGSYPGKARTPEELRRDMEVAFSLIPGSKRVNIHANYCETNGEKVERCDLKPEHFKNWVDWAKGHDLGLDFNGTFYSHPMSDDGFTLSHTDQDIRDYWVKHGQAARRIGAYFGKELGTPCVTNVWIPDGYKDIPVDQGAPRQRLAESLDRIFEEEIDEQYNLDAVESKLFGIGSESYVVGSHEFYMGYAMKNNKVLCLDAGHFHPTEVISTKISSVLGYVDEVLLHVSRPVRWDSDHVVIFDDELQSIMQEVVRGDYLDRVHIGLDFFDASINRIAAWVIGTRNTRKAILKALLEPTDMLKDIEANGDYTSRLAYLEALKGYPYAAVWDYYCMINEVPVRETWLDQVKTYEAEVLAKRD